MAWTTPLIEEISCGMEINMYFPADDGELFLAARRRETQR